jgi:hypothetical protein
MVNKNGLLFKLGVVFLIGVIIPTGVFMVFFYIWGLSPLVYITSGLSGALSAFLVILIIDYGTEKSGIKRFLGYFGVMYIVLFIVGISLLIIYNLPLPT